MGRINEWRDKPIDTRLISDINGTITEMVPHTLAEERYFLAHAIKALRELEGLSEAEARERYEELYQHSITGNRDGWREDPLYKGEFVPIQTRWAERGYKYGALSLEPVLRDGVRELFWFAGGELDDIILVSASAVDTTRAALDTVGLNKHVGSVYCSAEIPSKKTGEAFQFIADQEGLDLFDCTYIDDSPKNVLGALEAGVGNCVIVNEEGHTSEAAKRGAEVTTNFRKIMVSYDRHCNHVYDVVLGPP